MSNDPFNDHATKMQEVRASDRLLRRRDEESGRRTPRRRGGRIHTIGRFPHPRERVDKTQHATPQTAFSAEDYSP